MVMNGVKWEWAWEGKEINFAGLGGLGNGVHGIF